MSNFAIEGLISGFNTTELIEAMLDIQVRAPIDNIEERIAKETEKYTAIQTLNANMLSLDIASQGILSSAIFEGKKVSSSNESIVSASVNNSADLGTYSIRVDNLAKAQQISSDYFSNPNDELGLTGQFILNGKTITVNVTDSLSTLATEMNSNNSGLKASVVETAPNQYKLVLNSNTTGLDRIELREVGTDGILSDLGLIDANVSYDYTVNANTDGAISEYFDPADIFGANGQSFSITDGGNQHTITVGLTGARTIQELAQDINAESTAQGANIQAVVETDGSGNERLLITSDTGIPTEFSDPDNVLFSVGVVSGVQSQAFNSSVIPIADLLNLDTTGSSVVKLTDGDTSDSIQIDVDFTSDSLQSIADKINDAVTASGTSDLSAQVITVGTMSRLEIRSDSGNPLFDYEANADDGNVLKTLGIVDNDFKHYDQEGENAQLSFNGVTVNRNSNLVTDLVDGLSLALVQESSVAATVAVTEDLSGIEERLDNFVTAFNNVGSYVNEITLYDPTGENHGVLFGNATVRGLESALASGISRNTPNFPGAKISELNDGDGIDLGKIKITDRNGGSATVDLTDVETVQDILDKINSAQGLNVSAVINPAGLSFNIVDESGGTGALKVEEVDDGTTAQDLGIKSSIFGAQISGAIIYGGGTTSMSSIGISLTTAGMLSFDKNKLQSALNEDPDLVKNLLTADGIGFGDSFKSTVNSYSAYGSGLLDSASQSIMSRIESYNEQIERYEDRAAIMEKTLRKKFTALEVTLSQSQQMGDYLTQQLSTQNN